VRNAARASLVVIVCDGVLHGVGLHHRCNMVRYDVRFELRYEVRSCEPRSSASGCSRGGAGDPRHINRARNGRCRHFPAGTSSTARRSAAAPCVVSRCSAMTLSQCDTPARTHPDRRPARASQRGRTRSLTRLTSLRVRLCVSASGGSRRHRSYRPARVSSMVCSRAAAARMALRSRCARPDTRHRRRWRRDSRLPSGSSASMRTPNG
jgi:hypothetical protein